MTVKRIIVAIVLLGSILPVITGCFAVNSPPTARLTAIPTSGEAPLSILVSASGSYDSDGSIASYRWTFGDGGTGTGLVTFHSYSEAGSYVVRLTVTDNQGATDTATKTILVTVPPPPPTATFEITEWTQGYYEYSGEYSSYVYVYFRVTNTGTVHIDYYKVWIEVTCADGSKYQEWTNGSNVARGSYVTDYTLINVAGKQAVSVSVTNYELTSY